MSTLTLNPAKTALILIDLQNGIVAREAVPHTTAEILQRASGLAAKLRAKGGAVIYVNVDIANFLRLPTDENPPRPSVPPAPEAMEIARAAGRQPGDPLVTKRHWDAFTGTALEQELRSRGIETVLIGGISTHVGVESTVRHGAGLGFAFVVAEDICGSNDADAHQHSVKKIFPRLGHVRSTAEILTALA